MALKISMQGAIDLCFHSHPSLFPTIGDDLDVAVHAKQMGLRAVVIKCHHESTISRAYLLRKLVPDLEIFGGIVLNRHVGGFNPAAVEASLRLGGKSVWMPTIDAWQHGVVHGRTGSPEGEEGGRSSGEGLKALDDNGKLVPELYEILELIAKYDALLSTGHLSAPEIVRLVSEARNRGVKKILVNDPFAKAPQLDLDTLQSLVRMGATPEFGYSVISPQWAYASLREVKQALDLIGPTNAVLVSNTGQRYNPMPAESLRIFAQGLHEAGINEDHIYTMICRKPAELLGLPPGQADVPELFRPFPTVSSDQQ